MFHNPKRVQTGEPCGVHPCLTMHKRDNIRLPAFGQRLPPKAQMLLDNHLTVKHPRLAAGLHRLTPIWVCGHEIRPVGFSHGVARRVPSNVYPCS